MSLCIRFQYPLIDVHFGTIYGMDAGIGRILDQLKASGQFENTLIFFATDNGKAVGPYHHGFRITETQSHLVPIPGNGPLRGCKWTIWEGGVRVPFIARLPGGAQGATSNALQSIMDVLPTAFEFAGIEVEETSHWDGESFLATLNDPSQSNEDRCCGMDGGPARSLGVPQFPVRRTQADPLTDHRSPVHWSAHSACRKSV